jgi:hypothetical protein
MSALNLFNIISKFITCTMFAVFNDELFLSFEAICFTEPWYGQEILGYPALLIC